MHDAKYMTTMRNRNTQRIQNKVYGCKKVAAEHEQCGRVQRHVRSLSV